MKLELKHLVPYLPYKLKVVEWYLGKQIHDEFIVDCVNWDGENIGGSDATLDSFELERMFNLRDIKPILRPLLSMNKDEAKELMLLCLDYSENVKVSIKNGLVIIHGFWFYDYWHLVELTIDTKTGYINIEHDEDTTVKTIGYEVYEWLFKNHFDVFNLIENNLAIDKTKL